MTSRGDLYIELLNRALTEELGLVVSTRNPRRLSMILHEFTKGVEKFACLEITVPSTPNTLMLVKKSVSLDELSGASEGDLPDV